MFHIPPLRERPEDIAPLVETFISEFDAESGKGVTKIAPAVLSRLEQAAWPWNIRQLKGTVQVAVALATTDRLEAKDFSGIYSGLAWSLSPETQRTIMPELQNQTAASSRNSLKTIEEGEFLNIKNMNQKQILRAVAQQRLQQYTSPREAAESLNIDIRTLEKYAQWKESDE